VLLNVIDIEDAGTLPAQKPFQPRIPLSQRQAPEILAVQVPQVERKEHTVPPPEQQVIEMDRPESSTQAISPSRTALPTVRSSAIHAARSANPRFWISESTDSDLLLVGTAATLSPSWEFGDADEVCAGRCLYITAPVGTLPVRFRTECTAVGIWTEHIHDES
jgi:hypothetical protein